MTTTCHFLFSITFFLKKKDMSQIFSFGTGAGLVFVRSAYAQAQAYFRALNVLREGNHTAVATKFGFPAQLVNGVYSLDVPFVLASVTQSDSTQAVLAFGPLNAGSWPPLVLNPDGSYALTAPLNPALFGVFPQLTGLTIGNSRYFAQLGSPVHQFLPSMVHPDAVIVSIDDTHVATTTADGAVVDVSASLAQIVVTDPANDSGAVIAAQIQAVIAALENSCADFHNIGRIADYTDMLAQLQNASQTINLNLALNPDLASYNADLIAINALLSQITQTITDTVTIDGSAALQGILTFLQTLESCKIAIRDFHVAITSVAVITVPQSLSDATTSLKDFNSEVKCIADHLKYFATGVIPSDSTESPAEFELSAPRRAEIQAAIAAVNALVSIGNADLSNIEAQAVKDFQDQATALAASVSAFDSVLSGLTASLSPYLSPAAHASAQAAVAASQVAAQARAVRRA
jgi:hypothetical protein